MKYDFELEGIIADLRTDAEKSEDAIFLLLAYLYEKKLGNRLVDYRKFAKTLKYDFDRFWIFIYEVLSWNELSNEYRAMKQTTNLSFVIDKYR